MTTLPIITADQRLNETRGIKGCIFGRSGIGKTSLLWTLNPESTLFVDLEAGDLAVAGWLGDTLRPKTWEECRDMACFIGGANPALRPEQPYSQAHFDSVCQRYGNPSSLDKYQTIFIDSITVAGRLCFNYCQGAEQAMSQKTGKPDLRAAYGLHGQEMIAWITHLQHTRAKHIWCVGILNEKVDDYNRRFYQIQIEGSKTGLELPGIVDEVITMSDINDKNGNSHRAFICHTLNPYGYPAKDRSRRLDCIEKADLGYLMEKIQQKAPDTALNYSTPKPEPVTINS